MSVFEGKRGGMCVCVCEREREREGGMEIGRKKRVKSKELVC